MNGSSAIGVFDRNEKRLGSVISIQNDNTIPWVGMTVGAQSFALKVLPGELLGDTLYFVNADCSGAAYIPSITDCCPFKAVSSAMSFAAVKQPGGIVYATQANAPVVSVEVGSESRRGVCMDFGGPAFVQGVPATEVLSLDTAFPAPYTVR
jgi:hypothetical protein